MKSSKSDPTLNDTQPPEWILEALRRDPELLETVAKYVRVRVERSRSARRPRR